MFGLSLSAAAAVGFGFSTTFTAFLSFAILQGVAQSTGWSACSKVMSAWFSRSERGRVLGWWCTHYTAGAAFASNFAAWLIKHWGQIVPATVIGYGASVFWPAAFWGPAAVLVVVILLTGLLLRNRPEDVGLPPIDEYRGEAPPPSASRDRMPSEQETGAILKEVLSKKSVWLLAIAYFPIKLSRYSLYFWGTMFVTDSLGTDVGTSAFTSTWMPIGGMLGIISCGYISDKLLQLRRAPIMVPSLLATAGVMWIGLTKIESLWLMQLYFFLIGLFLYGPDSMISSTAAIDFGTKRAAGAATGFINGVGSLGAVVGVYLPSILANKDDWSQFLLVSLVGIVVSAIVLVPLWNVRPPKSLQEQT
jgi:OPA family sugar phosphate sensor protein UhpC-like MFS transporter